jgi:hypothetical protein
MKGSILSLTKTESRLSYKRLIGSSQLFTEATISQTMRKGFKRPVIAFKEW